MEIVESFRGTRLHDIITEPNEIIGSIRINPKNYTDAFIDNPDGGPDIYIEGSDSRAAAMDGDIVRVRLNEVSKWKLSYSIIANRWDDWSSCLMPIINIIEREEFNSSQANLSNNQSFDTKNSVSVVDENKKNPKSNRRVKRNTPELATKSQEQISKLPSNLPNGISKLKVEHILELKFSSECLQKTAKVVQIIKKNHMGIASGFIRPHSPEYALFSPTDSRVPRILIKLEECPSDFSSKPGRYQDILFVAQISKWEGANKLAEGNLLRIVGDCNKVQSRMEALLIENQIYDQEFPDDAYQELDYLNHLPENWFEMNCYDRRDLRGECVFTIDPKTARDLDDAVSIRQIAEQIYEVGVHIADVSFFTKELTAVDYYARLRTTSVYLVDRVIPMLPRILCERMCSLNPSEDKLTFSVIWKMDKYGHIIDEWFGRTIIRSCVKLAYEQAQDLIDNPNSISWIKEGSNMPTLSSFDWKRVSRAVILLNKIARNLRTRRYKEGALRIDQVKLKYELDPDSGYPTGFTFETRTDSHSLIEEFMLLANMSVAKRIYKHSREYAFLRRHPQSPVCLLKEVKEFCDAKGFPLDIESAGSIQRSLNNITDPTTAKVVSFLLLRAMKNAEYVCIGSLSSNDEYFSHFALNVPYYTHFTSPIRRYADVIVHRLLSIALGYENESNEDVHSLSLIADECNKRKLSSKLISETSQKLYFNLFVQKAGHCELLACVMRIYDASFDVILVDYDRRARVYLNNVKDQLESFRFESFSGLKRLVLDWKPTVDIGGRNGELKNKKSERHERRQLKSRSNLEARRSVITANTNLPINVAVNDKQTIEVFDVIRVTVTVDKKDITQLKVDLKTPHSSQRRDH